MFLDDEFLGFQSEEFSIWGVGRSFQHSSVSVIFSSHCLMIENRFQDLAGPTPSRSVDLCFAVFDYRFQMNSPQILGSAIVIGGRSIVLRFVIG